MVLNLDFLNLESIFRIFLACVLGGVIGFEREHKQMPAGLRTNILVCVGSTLVMLTSQYIFQKYEGLTNIDPARLGAQVISGIGFLGAGTIIRDGLKIKGLTTAAVLWAVACVGLAVGIGFYEGAVAVTVIIFIILIVLKRFEDYISERKKEGVLCVESEDRTGQMNVISHVLEKYRDTVTDIDIVNDINGKSVLVKIYFNPPDNAVKLDCISELNAIDGIQRIYTA